MNPILEKIDGYTKPEIAADISDKIRCIGETQHKTIWAYFFPVRLLSDLNNDMSGYVG